MPVPHEAVVGLVCGLIVPTLAGYVDALSIDRVRARVVVVVVVLREVLFFLTSVICVRVRGHGSEVTTTPYQISVYSCVLTGVDSLYYSHVICHVNMKLIGKLYSLAL